MGKFSLKEIQEQYYEDVSRKTPIDENKRHEAEGLNKNNAEWLVMAKWEDIEEKISEIGLQRGSPGYEEIRLLWKQVQRNIYQRRRKEP